MKIFLVILNLLACRFAEAQGLQFARTPVQLINGQFVVDCPFFPPSSNLANGGVVVTWTNYVYVTNYVFSTVTNYVFITATNSVPRPSMELTNNILTTPMPGTRMDYFKFVNQPTVFTMGQMAVGDEFVIEIFNGASNLMTWPSGIKLPNGPLPTNAARAWPWFKNVQGEIWASP
jgi:hypothetical protein